MPHWIRVYVVPAAVFQAVLIGGGYGTGREAAEFVTQAGPVGGIVAVGFFFLALTLVLMASFEFARTFQTYDYRHFFQQLLGSAWWLYEVLAVLLFVLVLAVVISASSTLALDWFGIPVLYTSIGIIIVTLHRTGGRRRATHRMGRTVQCFFDRHRDNYLESPGKRTRRR